MLGLLASLLLGGCAPYLANHTLPRLDSLRPESSRADLLRDVGPPRHSTVYARPVKAWMVDLPEGRAFRLDEFRLSGRWLLPGDGIDSRSRWDWYWTEFIGSAGTSELTAVPATVGKLVSHAVHPQEVWVWYDRADRVLSFDTASPEQREREFEAIKPGWTPCSKP